MNQIGFYGVSKWRKAFSASLTAFALVLSSAAPLLAFPHTAEAGDNVYTVSAGVPVVSGTEATVSGIGTASGPGVNSGTIHVAIDWNHDGGSVDIESEFVQVGVPFSVTSATCTGDGCSISWGSVTHDYASAGAGTYTAYAIIYHGGLPGNDGLEASQIDSFEIIILPQCSNGIDDDNDGLFDFSGGDPGCTDANDDTESPNPNTAPVAVADSYSTNEDTALVISVPGVLSNDSDAEGNSLTAILGTDVSQGVLVLNADGSFSYTPNSNFNGSDSFTYTVSDGLLTSAPATVTIDVDGVNDLPEISDIPDATIDELTPISLTASATDVEGSVTYSLSGGPAGALFNTTTGEFSWTPTEAQGPGSYPMTVTATDTNGGTDSDSFTITVNEVNAAPVAIGAAVTTHVETALPVTLAGTDSDVPVQTLSFSIVTPPTNGTLGSVSGTSVTYTPNPGFEGSDSFTFVVNDSALDSAPATISIIVNNNAPTLDSIPDQTIDELALLSFTITGSDPDGDTPLTYSLLTAPLGALIDSLSGLFTWTPGEDQDGIYLLTAQVSDSFGTDSKTFTITVNEINVAPTVSDENLSTPEDTVLVDNVSGTDTDIPMQALSFALVTSTTNGVLVFNPDGSFTYTPALNYYGLDSFTFTASDGSLISNSGTVDIDVTPVNDIPEILLNGSDPINLVQGDLFTDPSATASDVEDGPLTPVVTGSVDTGIAGTYILTYTATDSNLESVSVTRTVTITALPVLTIIKSATGADGSFTFSVTGEEDVVLDVEDDSSTSVDLILAPDASYDVVESVPAGWTLSSSYCEYDGEETGDQLLNGHTVFLDIGDHVTCYFENTATGADLSVEKSVDDATPDAGQTVQFSLTVSNAGPATANNVSVLDALPSGLTYVSDDSEGAYSTTTGAWTVGSLLDGESATLVITATVSASAGQTVVNIASVSFEDESVSDYVEENNDDEVSITVNTPSGGGGGGGSTPPPILGGGITGLGGGQVLGASTVGQVLGESCGLFMDQYLRRGNTKNRADQVTKLQEFLVKHGYGTFTPTGFFGPLTENAVKAFQSAYAQNVLAPWGLSQPTGLAYLTTLRQLNLIECPDLSLTIPELVEWSKNPQVAGFVAGATFTETENVTPPPSLDEPSTDETEEDESSTEVDATSNEDASNGQKGFWGNFLKGIFGR